MMNSLGFFYALELQVQRLSGKHSPND